MATLWVLIIVMGSSGGVTYVPFQDVTSCLKAKEWALEDTPAVAAGCFSAKEQSK